MSLVKPKLAGGPPGPPTTGKFDIGRLRFNLDKSDLDDGLSFLIHGNYGAGKTHLIGDMLREEAKDGPIAFINTVGEDGSTSVADMGLGEQGYNVSSRVELLDLCDYFIANGRLAALGIDSARVLQHFVIRAVVGKERWESLELDIQPGEWNNIHRAMSQTLLKLKQTAKWVLCVCTSDISVDMVTSQTTTSMGTKSAGGKVSKGSFVSPDLYGKMHSVIAASFDMAGFLRAEAMGNKAERSVRFTTSNNILTRQRLTHEITADIPIPHGKGGWTAIKNTVEAHMKKGGG